MTMGLEQEMAAFTRELPTLLADPTARGRFALVHGDCVEAVTYSTFEDALAAGYDTFGLEQFMVKEVTDHEEPKYFSRNIRCPS